MRKVISLSLVLLLMLSLCAVSFAEPVRADDESTTTQLNLIFNSLGTLKQEDAYGTWCYTVTDLDHNGRLELLAASRQGGSSSLKVWEVNAELTDFNVCEVRIPDGQSFPNIITDNTDTYYDADADAWFYIFYDNLTLSANDVYAFKCSVSFKEGAAGFTNLATQHTQVVNGFQTTAYIDSNGVTISPEQYNASGMDAFGKMIRSSTNFDWFYFTDAASVVRLADSYAIFKGVKEPDKTVQSPVVTPAPAPASGTGSAPAATYTAPAYFAVTKNPTSESHYVGESALFISNASTWTSLSWTFVSPDGGEYSSQSFRNIFPGAYVSGEYSTSLTVSNLTTGMSGWGVYCTFYNNSQTARTSTAYIYVMVKPAAPAPTANPYSTVIAPGYYSVYQGNGTYTEFHGNEGFTTYYPDGSSYTQLNSGTAELNFGDGSSLVTYGDGTGTYYDNGSWISFDSNGAVISGGIDYDDYYPEVYSSTYGWGTLYSFPCYGCGNIISASTDVCPYCGYHYYG